MTKKVTEVLTEDGCIEMALKLIDVANSQMNSVAYQTAGVFAMLSIAVSLKRLADMKDVELNWGAGNYNYPGPDNDNTEGGAAHE